MKPGKKKFLSLSSLKKKRSRSQSWILTTSSHGYVSLLSREVSFCLNAENGSNYLRWLFFFNEVENPKILYPDPKQLTIIFIISLFIRGGFSNFKRLFQLAYSKQTILKRVLIIIIPEEIHSVNKENIGREKKNTEVVNSISKLVNFSLL